MLTERAKRPSLFVTSLLLSLSFAAARCSDDGDDDDGSGGAAGAGGETGGKGGGATGGSSGKTGGTGGGSATGGGGGEGGDRDEGGAGGGGGSGGEAETLHHLYVGCRDALGSVQHYRISSRSGEVELIDTTTTGDSTSNFAINADGTFVYLAHADEGRITTLSRDTTTGELSVEGAVTVPGNAERDPGSEAPFNVNCLDAVNTMAPTNPATQTLTITPSGDFLIASNWCANTVLVYEIKPDGLVGELVQSLVDGVSSHHAVFDSTGEFVLVPYFGSDFIASYGFDDATGMLSPTDPLTTLVPAESGSSGPRHLAFHPTHTSWLYSINETAGSISYFHFDASDGTLTHQETVSSLPDDSTFTIRSGSEIEIDAAGEFLYVSNRVDGMANGSIGVYAIGPDGTLTSVEYQDTGGTTPRHFSLSPDGGLLVVTNQGSDNMRIFSVNDSTGALEVVGTSDVCTTPFFARMVAP